MAERNESRVVAGIDENWLLRIVIVVIECETNDVLKAWLD